MAEDIKGLIEKIQQEGIHAAEEKAKEIQEQAKKRADELIRNAKLKAEEISDETKEELVEAEASHKALLAQAGRDFLLTVRKEVNSLLHKLIIAKTREALTPQALTEILAHIVKETVKPYGKAEIIVTLKEDDLKSLQESLFGKLSEEIKKGLVLKPSDEITAGFLISYDGGKSQFDFSDRALAEFIGSSLKPKLEELLKQATQE